MKDEMLLMLGLLGFLGLLGMVIRSIIHFDTLTNPGLLPVQVFLVLAYLVCVLWRWFRRDSEK